MLSSLDIQVLLVVFREAFEAFLILGLIITYLKRCNEVGYVRWVWAGSGLALVASCLFALLFQVVLTSYTAMGSEIYMKVGIMLVSSVLLTQMILWMARQNEDMKGNMERQLDLVLTQGSIWGMVFHAFLVVVREGVETVFFFAAISQGRIDQAMGSVGLWIGLAAAACLAYLFFARVARFSLKTFFRVTGGIILLIAAGFLVSAVGILQDLHMIPSVMPHVYDLSWLMPENPIDEMHYIREIGHAPLISGHVGIFFNAFLGYTHNPSIEQVLAYLTYFVVVYTWMRHKRMSVGSKQGVVLH